MPTNPTSPTIDLAPRAASPTVRTVASFLLFLHLFALAVAIGANTGTPSPLQQALRLRVPGVRMYTQLLGLDTSYMVNLTYGEADDTDHAIVAELGAPGQASTVTLPADDLQPAIRRQRYLRLARQVAMLADDQSLSATLPQSIAVHLLNEAGADTAVIRCRRHFTQIMASPRSSNPADRDPYSPQYYSTVYEAQAFLARGEVRLLRRETASDVAPAADTSNGSAGGP